MRRVGSGSPSSPRTRSAMFDPAKERSGMGVPTSHTYPYDVFVDRNGELWSGSMSSDRILRFDPERGTSVEYLLPRETNVRRVFVDNSTTPVTFWVGSNHGASIIKLNPLDGSGERKTGAPRQGRPPAADTQPQGGFAMHARKTARNSAALAALASAALAFASPSPPRPRVRKAQPSGNHPPPELRQERLHAVLAGDQRSRAARSSGFRRHCAAVYHDHPHKREQILKYLDERP